MVMVDSNPLAEYRTKHKLTWPALATRTGVSIPHIQRIAKGVPENMRTIEIATALAIQQNTGVDLVAYVNKHFNFSTS